MVDDCVNRIKVVAIIFAVVILALWIGSIFYFQVEALNIISGILAAVCSFAGVAYCIIYGKAYSFESSMKMLREIIERRIKQKYGFLNSRFEELKELEKSLSQELNPNVQK